MVTIEAFVLRVWLLDLGRLTAHIRGRYNNVPEPYWAEKGDNNVNDEFRLVL
jgi:hypothetical protein